MLLTKRAGKVEMTMTGFLLALAILAAALLVHGEQGDTITPDRTLADGQNLVSAGGIFELGFFTPPGSKNRYLGIWYKDITPEQTVAWVANKDAPLNNSRAGTLNLTADGNLILLSNPRKILWSTGTSNTINPVMQLLDSGNFVLTGRASKTVLWQSFDHPTDTFLPGMKVGWDLRSNLDTYLTSWKSDSDPSQGDYIYQMGRQGIPEPYIWKGSDPTFGSGVWDGKGWGSRPDMSTNTLFHFQYDFNQYEAYYIFEVLNSSVLSRGVIHESGIFQHFVWSNGSNEWNLYWWFPQDVCDDYANCGPNGICRTNYSPVCECLKGFVPKSPEEWSLRNNSSGCVRRTALNCSSDGFYALQNVKLPDSQNASLDTNKTLDECRDWCSKNCFCQAYAISGEFGCMTWAGNLVDIRVFSKGGQVLYVRVAASELGYLRVDSNKKKAVLILIIPSVLGALLVLCLGTVLWKKSNTRKRILLPPTRTRKRGQNHNASGSEGDELELPLFDMSTIKVATDDFSINNKLGEGGFGPVYKGKLVDRQEIAVKVLSKNSMQGIDEFKTEVMLIAQLQHRNLVRLLGCCIEKGERMLIYEYMQNKSLDTFIFDKAKSVHLSWRKRLNILVGIARGLLYLHRDSRLKIIHRDLKASNILLDHDMNPKISDFGTARVINIDQIEANTMRVVGTYGYMSPEYAMDSIFSEKSDVFSFGILLLEILSGKKNRLVHQAGLHINLLGHAWRLWQEDRCLELLDEAKRCPFAPSEALRCIQVSFLCVQERSKDRPAMADVVKMLESDTITLPQPTQPGFCMPRTFMGRYRWPCTNEITMTLPEGR